VTVTGITAAFIHGLDSSGSGTKGAYFRDQYPDMIIEDYFGSFQKRMSKLENVLRDKDNLILIGSSFGGLMAAVFACLHEARVLKLILLAPALHLQFYDPYRNRSLCIPTIIYHGFQDVVVPLDAIRKTAEALYPNHTFHAVEDDHSLHSTFRSLDWDSLLIP